MNKNLTKLINKKTYELYNDNYTKDEFKEKRRELIIYLHEFYSQEHSIKSLQKRLHFINNVENQYTGILNSIITGLISTLIVYTFIDDKFNFRIIFTEILNGFSQVINSNANLFIIILFLFILLSFFILLLLIVCSPIIALLVIMFIDMSNKKDDVFLTYDIERKLMIKSMGINKISFKQKIHKVNAKSKKIR